MEFFLMTWIILNKLYFFRNYYREDDILFTVVIISLSYFKTIMNTLKSDKKWWSNPRRRLSGRTPENDEYEPRMSRPDKLARSAGALCKT